MLTPMKNQDISFPFHGEKSSSVSGALFNIVRLLSLKGTGVGDEGTGVGDVGTGVGYEIVSLCRPLFSGWCGDRGGSRHEIVSSCLPLFAFSLFHIKILCFLDYRYQEDRKNRSSGRGCCQVEIWSSLPARAHEESETDTEWTGEEIQGNRLHQDTG